MQALETLEIAQSESIDSSVIWLHGLDADGHDFEFMVHELKLSRTRFILPHAPQRPVTLNGGYVMRAWYDIYGLGTGSKQDETGIRQTEQQIMALIAREQQRGINTKRIVLAGFSQGGAMALHTALRHAQPLAGVVALSTYLPLVPQLHQEALAENHPLPIFMAHGRLDTVIALAVGKNSAEVLKLQGFNVAWHEYAMAHALCLEELQDIREFLCKVLD